MGKLLYACGSCNGTGYKSNRPCNVCGGRGRLDGIMPAYEREQLAEIIKTALEEKVKMTLYLTRAKY